MLYKLFQGVAAGQYTALRLAIAAALCCPAVTLLGQTLEEPPGPPVAAVVVKSQEADSLQVAALHQAIQDNFHVDRVNLSLQLLDSLLSFSSFLGKYDPQPYLLLNIGLLAWKAEDYDTALDAMERAVSAFDTYRTTFGLQSVLGGLRTFYIAAGQQQKRLEFYRQKLEYYKEFGPKENTGVCYHGIAGYFLTIGLYEKAIENYFRSAEEVKDKWPKDYVNEISVIGGCYADWGNSEKALEYLNKGRELALKNESWSNVSYCLRHLAQVSESNGQYEEALKFLNEGLEIAKKQSEAIYQLLFLTDIGRIQVKVKNFPQAWVALHAAESLRNQTQAPFFSTHGAVELDMVFFQLYREQKFMGWAENYLKYALHQAEMNRLNTIRLQYYRIAAQFYDEWGEKDSTLAYYRRYANLKDSLNRLDNSRRVAIFEMDLAHQKKIDEISRKGEQSEMELKQRLLGVGLTVFLLGIFLAVISRQLHRNRRQTELLKRQKETIDAERRKSEELLLNILPEEVAEELKQHKRADGRLYEEVTVVITDFVGFTTLTEQLSPHDLIRELDTCFRAFDAIIEKNELEKIKTVGDGYIAAAGVPTPRPDHAERAVRAALEMAAFVQEYQERGGVFAMRVGVHTGPVIAGIVGAKKFAYDIWGDTVNVAARMEQAGEPGKINISGETYRAVKDRFVTAYRGKIGVKGKGEIDMYFVSASIPS